MQQRAQAAGIDTSSTAFPFLLTGAPAELTWHINVDRTEGRPITRELFQQSKQTYIMREQPVTIIGFYSELHLGSFIGTYAPGITDPETKNAMHMHLVSQDGLSAGHIDDVRLSAGMILSLPE